MEVWTEELERRQAVRVRQSLACEVRIGEARHPGVLEEVSVRSVVVRLEAMPRGAVEAAEVRFWTQRVGMIALRTVPARKHLAPHRLRGLAPHSLVLRVVEFPEHFLRWLRATLPRLR